jgi:hypothetical protein
MSYIAAFLLLFMDDYSAFVCFVNVLNSPCFHLLYHMDDKNVRFIVIVILIIASQFEFWTR